LNSFHCFIFTMSFGSGWLSWYHYDVLVHFRMSLSRFHGLTGVCSKPQRSQVSVSLVCGKCLDDELWPDIPQTATMQEGMFIEYLSLSNFESVVAHWVLFVFSIFSSGVTSWLRYWSVCSNVECLRLIGRRDFQMMGGK
jgi:hypothetical protein